MCCVLCPPPPSPPPPSPALNKTAPCTGPASELSHRVAVKDESKPTHSLAFHSSSHFSEGETEVRQVFVAETLPRREESGIVSEPSLVCGCGGGGGGSALSPHLCRPCVSSSHSFPPPSCLVLTGSLIFSPTEPKRFEDPSSPTPPHLSLLCHFITLIAYRSQQ